MQSEPVKEAELQKVASEVALVGEEGEALAAAFAAESDEVPVPKYRPPAFVRYRFCKICRLTCFRDPKKPKLSLTQVCCPTFMQKRSRVTQFKTSWKFL